MLGSHWFIQYTVWVTLKHTMEILLSNKIRKYQSPSGVGHSHRLKNLWVEKSLSISLFYPHHFLFFYLIISLCFSSASSFISLPCIWPFLRIITPIYNSTGACPFSLSLQSSQPSLMISLSDRYMGSAFLQRSSAYHILIGCMCLCICVLVCSRAHVFVCMQVCVHSNINGGEQNV